MSKHFRMALAQLAIIVCSVGSGVGPGLSMAFGEPNKEPPSRPKTSTAATGSQTQQYCVNVAAAAGAAQMAHQEARLVELDRQMQKRLGELEAKRAELHDLLDRYDAFTRKADEALAAVYARMKPDAAASLAELRALPSNRLEALRGDRADQYSIRINMQWRICFEWTDGAPGPSNVEIVDYH